MSKQESHSNLGNVWNVDKYRPMKTLMEFTFGKVQLAMNPETNHMVTMKVIDNKHVLQQTMSRQVKKTISIMKQLKHPHVVQVKEAVTSRTKFFIIMEHMARGELRSELASRGGKLSEDAARRYFRQMIKGLQYIHSHGIYHCNLKLQNLLLDSHGDIKISDFGLCKLTSGATQCHCTANYAATKCLPNHCTANYMAPEHLASSACVGKPADVWSCGVILYYLLAGHFPFEDKNVPFIFQRIRRAKLAYPSGFSAEVKSLLSQILVNNPKDRITLEGIQKHAWFNKGFGAESPRRHMPIAVTEKQLVHAVCTAQMTATTPRTTATTTTTTNADVAAPATPPTLNAFDLMSCAGGLALDNLFNYHRGSHASWKRFYHFESGLPVDAIIEGIKAVMHSTRMATLQNETPNSMDFHVKRKRQHIDIHVDISTVLSGLHMITMRCVKGGHPVAYYKFMTEVGPCISKEIGVKNQGLFGIGVAKASTDPVTSDV